MKFASVLASAALALSMLTLATAVTAEVINLDAVSSPSRALLLDPGAYTVALGDMPFVAWSFRNTDAACETSPGCLQGFDDIYNVKIGATILQALLPGGSFNYGFAQYATPQLAYVAYAALPPLTFLLDGRTSVTFHLDDNHYADNRGGISLLLSVPEPATWVMMFIGLAAIGAAIGTRRGTGFEVV
jgi:hypothetical protein